MVSRGTGQRKKWLGALSWLLAVCLLAGCAEKEPPANSSDAAAPDLADSSTDDPSDSANPDSAAPDSAIPLDGSGSAACPGGFACTCQSAADCDSGACVKTPDGMRCSRTCAGDCPAGWSCKGQLSGVDTTAICVASYGVYCLPCTSSLSCSASGLPGSSCVRYGDHGAFCGAPCASSADCPKGSECQDLPKFEGGSAKQCAPAGASAGKPQSDCPCSATWSAAAEGTLCQVSIAATETSPALACVGERKCGPTGLSPCAALTGPQANCTDLQCQGKADGSPCDDGKACNSGDACQAGQCQGNPCACALDSDCAALEDGNLCNGKLACYQGKSPWVCMVDPSTLVVCPGGKAGECSAPACKPSSGKCEATPLPKGTTCSDDEACTLGDLCDGQGQCTPGNNGCNCLTNQDCEAQDQDLCDSKLYCDASAVPWQCKPIAGSAVSCPASSACTAVACNPKTGKCDSTFKPATTLCDDGEPCTVGDSCSDGVCKPGTEVCCKNDGDCPDSDANPCTGTPFCNKVTKKCELNPKTVVQCAAGKDSTCAANTCQPSTGKCAFVPKGGVGVACDDGDPCTLGDACDGKGSCEPGKASCTCTADSDCNAKEDANLCNGKLFCNKAVGQCQVNPATVVSCPTSADSACLQSQCQPSSGQCKLQAVAGSQVPCSDGNACTSGDVCDGKGGCLSGANTCPCQSDLECLGKDDGNLCNGVPYCDKQSGQCQPNPATAISCPSAGDTPCLKDQCTPATGLCAPTPVNLGATCSDGNPCTAGDLCNSGGECAPGPDLCGCGKDKPCPDKNLCDGIVIFCDTSLAYYQCSQELVLPVQCQGDACNTGVCAPSTGSCSTLPKDASPCDDGNACTDKDSCAKGQCLPGKPADCNDNNPCTDDSCDPKKSCQHAANATQLPCYTGKAGTSGTGICMAGTRSCQGGVLASACVGEVVPASSESCNGALDDNCDGSTDEPDSTGCTAYYLDGDGDGYGVGGSLCLCSAGAQSGFTALLASDCSPADASVSPGAKEICDGLDQNCNGSTDELCTCPSGTVRVDLAAGFLCVPDVPVWGIRPDDPGSLLTLGSGATAGIATDKGTGLMWQQTWDAGKNWLDAQKYCHAQNTGGFTDWRLPTIAELASVRNLTKAPMLPSVFSGPQGAMWSAVAAPGNFKPGWYYTLSGSHGLIEVMLGSTTSVNYRCVRGLPSKVVPKVRFSYDKAKNIASDSLTGLQWYIQSKVAVNQPDAKVYCTTLQQDGKGWRLPNLQEVESLLYRANYMPALDPVLPPLNLSAHWSSNTHPSSGDGLLAGFNNALSSMYPLTTQANAVCVR